MLKYRRIQIMPTKTQDNLWKNIERDAKTAGVSPATYLTQHPDRYVAWKDASPQAPQNPYHANPAARVVEELVADMLTAHPGMSKGAAYAAVLGHGGDPALYENYQAERGKRLPNAPKQTNGGGQDGPAKGPLTPAELVALQAMARELGTDLTLDELAGAGWVNARALMADIADGTLTDDDDAEAYGEIVRFTD